MIDMINVAQSALGVAFHTLLIGLPVTLATLAVLILIQSLHHHYHYAYRQGIPALTFIPFIGQIRALKQYMNGDHRELFSIWLLHHMQSPIVSYFLGSTPWLCVADTVAFHHIMHRDHHQVFQKTTLVRHAFQPMMGDESLVLMRNGVDHQGHRKVIASLFQYDNLRSMFEIMVEGTQRNMDALIQSNDAARDLDVHEFFAGLTLDLMCQCMFGESIRGTDGKDDTTVHTIYSAFAEARKQCYQHFISLFNNIPVVSDLASSFRKRRIDSDAMMVEVNRLTHRLMADRMAGKTQSRLKGKDLLDLLSEARDEKWNGFTPKEIQDDCRMFVFAGHEMISTLLTWTLYQLSQHPDALTTLRDEVDHFYAHHDRMSQDDSASELAYMNAVIQETLRCTPNVPELYRVATEDTTLPLKDGRSIDVIAGTVIQLPIIAMQNQESEWGDTAHQFMPERWMKSHTTPTPPSSSSISSIDPITIAPEAKKSHPALLAFNIGAGVRGCAGQHFTLQEAKIVLCEFLHRFDFTLMMDPQRVYHQPGITLKPKHGLRIRITPRSTRSISSIITPQVA